MHTCTSLYIAKTLTKEQQAKLSEDAFKIKESSPVSFINKLYGKTILPVNSIDEITEKLFSSNENGHLKQDKNNEITSMLIPTCFGGRKILAKWWEDDLVRFIRPFNLICGDVIVSVKDMGKTIYLVTEKGILDCSSYDLIDNTEKFTEHIIATNQYFAILRPSMSY